MTNDNAKQETSDGEYNGLYYIEVTGNENIVINYTYTNKGCLLYTSRCRC